jgi:4'-phosphopantetheinyl transferase
VPPDVDGDGPLVLTAHPGDVLRTMDRAVLTASERRRSAALRHPADQDAHAAAHLLVRSCAAALTGRPATQLGVVQSCADCGSTEHGRPAVAGLPDLHVSLAHTRGAVVAGAAWRPVGVDVERARVRGPGPADMTYVLSATEIGRVRSAEDPSAAFLRHWVRKECLVKIGACTLDQLSAIEIDARSERDVGEGRTVTRFGSLYLTDWLDRGLDAVIAVAGERPPVVGTLPGVSADPRP